MKPAPAGHRLTVKTSVLGTGYLGATHAACLNECGHEVVGIDTDPARIERLSTGVAPFHEPGLDALLRKGIDSGRLRFSCHIEEAAAAEVHFVCVGTPQRAGSDSADLSFVFDCISDLAKWLTSECLVVGRSTVPVGTAARVRDELHRLAPAGDLVHTAWNPEFLREGFAVQDSLHPDRLVFGVESDVAYQTLREVYEPLLRDGVPVVRTDLATAELAKVAANAMLATRVSLVNMLAEICEVANADVGDLAEILGRDPRIGPTFLTPGIGYGGGCLPKDTRAFVVRAEELGVGEAAQLLRAVDGINTRQRDRTVAMCLTLTGRPMAETTVAVLGAAFKPGSDDVRDSPALDIAGRLRAYGARVRVYDPAATANARVVRPELEYALTVHDACVGADVTMVLTDWDEFAGIDPVALSHVVRRPCVIDGRLSLDPDKWRAAGWDFHALGRGSG
jgi:UDPglucose 6-dehydrogenase